MWPMELGVAKSLTPEAGAAPSGCTGRSFPHCSIRFHANRVKTVVSAIHNFPFLLVTGEGDEFISHPKKLGWREIGQIFLHRHQSCTKTSCR